MSGEKLPGWRELPIAGIPYKFSTEYKTGDWKSFRPVIDENKCVKCLTCVAFCPDMAMKAEFEDDKPKRVYPDYNYCKGCGICAEVCPVKCIKMVPEV